MKLDSIFKIAASTDPSITNAMKKVYMTSKIKTLLKEKNGLSKVDYAGHNKINNFISKLKTNLSKIKKV